MFRMMLCVGALALASPALAQSDPSNPGNAPLTPSAGSTNQPTRAEVAPNALPSAARDTMDQAAPLTGDEADSAESSAINDAIRASEAAARAPRKARIGERIVQRDSLPGTVTARQ